MLEARDSFDSTFLTLTYDDDHLPCPPHLVKEDLTLFLKRYRKRLGHKIRYYAIGEYGDLTWRPHFHLAIFSEKRLERCIRSCEDMRKRDQCTQDCIAKLSWNYGNISVTDTLTSSLAGYITGYIKKKATKEARINRPNEYATQSRGRRKDGHGGIGYRAITKLADQLKHDPRTGQNVIRSLSIGGGQKPLGGYLTKCLADQLGVSELIFDNEFTLYSQELIRENSKDGLVIPELLKNTEGKRNSQVVKDEIFNKKRISI